MAVFFKSLMQLTVRDVFYTEAQHTHTHTHVQIKKHQETGIILWEGNWGI